MARKIIRALRIITNDGTGAPLPIDEPNRGIIGGEFHFITGDETFVDSADIEGDDIDSAAMRTWYSGFIIKGSLQNPLRAVDIVDGGSYGTASSFGFALDNTNVDMQAFFAWCQDQGIQFVNRIVILYAFIKEDDESPWVSFRRWSGIIATNPFTETEYNFRCAGDFPAKSRLYPSRTLTNSEFPGLDDTANNQTLPIALGYVERAITRKITTEAESPLSYLNVGMDSPEGANVFSAFAVAYRTTDGDRPYLVFYTPRVRFAADQMKGWVMRSVRGAGEAVMIAGNAATTNDDVPTTGRTNVGPNFTFVYLEKPLANVGEDYFNFSYERPEEWNSSLVYGRGDVVAAASNQAEYRSLRFNNAGRDPTDLDNIDVWWEVVPALQTDYKGEGYQLALNATGVGLSYSPMGIYGAMAPYADMLVLGEFGALAIYVEPTSFYNAIGGRFVMLRGMFRYGEFIYATPADPNGRENTRRYAILSVDEADNPDDVLIIGDFNDAGIFFKGLDTNGSGRCYISVIDAGGGNRTLNVYSNSARTNLRATVTYSSPGLKTLTPVGTLPFALWGLSTTLVRGTVLINNMETTTKLRADMFGTVQDPSGLATNYAFTRNIEPRYVINRNPLDYPDQPSIKSGLLPSSTVTYWQMFKNSLTFLTSQNAVAEYVPGQRTTAITVYREGNYYGVDSLLSDSATAIDTTASGAPNILRLPFVALNSWKSPDGRTFSILFPMAARYIGFSNQYLTTLGANQPILSDKDRATFISFSFSDANRETQVVYLKVFPPKELFDTTFDKIYILPDITMIGAAPFQMSAAIVRAVDTLGAPLYEKLDSMLPNASLFFPGGSILNFLPNFYYALGGDAAGEASRFNTFGKTVRGVPFAYESLFLLPESMLAAQSKIFNYAVLALQLRTAPNPPSGFRSMRIKQVGFVGQFSVDIARENIYVRTIGEFVPNGDAPVTNLYEAFCYFAMNDGIYASQSEVRTNLNDLTGVYGNLFPVGRNLTTQRSSKEWITDMTRQGWFCAFPDRTGKLNAINWLLKVGTAPEYADSASTNGINSISLERSDYKRIYNSFPFRYHWDPGRGNYARAIEILRTDEATFPLPYVSTNAAGDAVKVNTGAIITLIGGIYYADVTSVATGLAVGDVCSFSSYPVSFYFRAIISKTQISGLNNRYRFEIGPTLDAGNVAGVTASGVFTKQGSATPLWALYVTGLPSTIGGYVTAKNDLWTPCHEAYLKTLAIQVAPSDLTDLSWFIDKALFYENPAAQPLPTLAALNTAKLHAQWTTKQKDILTYTIPLDPTSATRELLAYGSTRDYVYTRDQARLGWVVGIEDVIESEELRVRVMLSPDGLVVPFAGEIDEVGDAEDEIDETGAADDDIDETGGAT